MTLPEAAVSLGVTTGMLRHQIANGRLMAQKIGRDWHVSEAEVEHYRAASLGRPGPRPKAHVWCDGDAGACRLNATVTIPASAFTAELHFCRSCERIFLAESATFDRQNA